MSLIEEGAVCDAFRQDEYKWQGTPVPVDRRMYTCDVEEQMAFIQAWANALLELPGSSLTDLFSFFFSFLNLKKICKNRKEFQIGMVGHMRRYKHGGYVTSADLKFLNWVLRRNPQCSPTT